MAVVPTQQGALLHWSSSRTSATAAAAAAAVAVADARVAVPLVALSLGMTAHQDTADTAGSGGCWWGPHCSNSEWLRQGPHPQQAVCVRRSISGLPSAVAAAASCCTYSCQKQQRRPFKRSHLGNRQRMLLLLLPASQPASICSAFGRGAWAGVGQFAELLQQQQCTGGGGGGVRPITMRLVLMGCGFEGGQCTQQFSLCCPGYATPTPPCLTLAYCLWSLLLGTWACTPQAYITKAAGGFCQWNQHKPFLQWNQHNQMAASTPGCNLFVMFR